MKVFWSWQSDTPAEVGMNFIKSAISDALSAIHVDLQLSEANRPGLDHDTKDTVGWAEVVNTIFSKIQNSSVFVADATPTLRSVSGKYSLNPNVLIELGYALRALGPECIVLVWNTAGGRRAEDLPFDIRHRTAPIEYCLDEKANASQRKKAMTGLAAKLKSALTPILVAALNRQDSELHFKLQPSRPNDPSIWLPLGAKIEGHELWSKKNGWTRFNLIEAPRSYVRMVPYAWEKTIPRARDVQRLCNHTWRLSPLFQHAKEDSGWATNPAGGVSIYDCEHPVPETFSATQWFEENGEVWSFDSSIVQQSYGLRTLDGKDILKDWREFIKYALEFYTAAFKKFTFTLPLRVEIGLTGIENVLWEAPQPENFFRAKQKNSHFARDASFVHTFFVRRIEEFDLDREFERISEDLHFKFGHINPKKKTK